MIFCKSGGCSAKLGPKVLSKVLSKLPKFEDENLLVGFDSSDDASVYKLTDDIAMIQTLDIFQQMVNDPYIFGQIAATNAVSDIYAMGGTVKTAQNIVCFPENEDLNILGQIMAGGASKIMEAGGILSGGHSVNDESIKYGLAVTGIVNPQKIYQNNTIELNDDLILTKPLGVGIIVAANSVGEASDEAMQKAIKSMTTLNKKTAEIMTDYDVHACTDVTGFGFICHLLEMVAKDYSVDVYADNFLITSAGQRNRNFAGDRVSFADEISFAMQEVLFDPQTSGGLLISVNSKDSRSLVEEMQKAEIDARIVGKVTNLVSAQNLEKMASQMNLPSQKVQQGTDYIVSLFVKKSMFIPQQEEIKCEVPTKTDNSFVVVVSSNVMGHGDDKLGSILIKGFIYSLTCLETLPKAVIFYNSGVKLAVEGSEVLEDLKTLADAGVEIVACGTCLEFYQLKEKLAVGKIVNMLDIVERQAKATKVVKP